MVDRAEDGERRGGFTLVEMAAALAILGVVLLVVAQLGAWSLRERWHAASRQAALELAANLMESARAEPWEKLSSDWAERQQLADELKPMFPKGVLAVTVQPEKDQAGLKRVTVGVRWQTDEGVPEQVVQLVGLVGRRTAAVKGEKK